MVKKNIVLKKITSIILLILFLHNMLGYYFMMALKELDVKNELSNSIKGGNISDSEMRVFKVPLSFYHQPDRKGFEDVRGELQHEGKFFEMVKQRLENDTLYVYCVDNKEKKKVVADLSEHTKANLTDFKNHTNKKQKTSISFIKEYLTLQTVSFYFNVFPVLEISKFKYQEHLEAVLIEKTSPPPKV